MNALIIGGTNKTAINVSKELENNGYSIDCITYRNQEKITKDFNTWVHLDLFSTRTLELFLKNQSNKKYNKIVLFVSSSLPRINPSKNALKDFYGIFCVNYIELIEGLMKTLDEEGSMVFISSRAAEMGCKDPVYSSGKALIQNYIISLNNFLSDKQSAYSISPGTIFGSSSYESLPEGHRDKIDGVTFPKEIADLILEAQKNKGKVISVGWAK
jgi:short-subunit dehydrogenase